MAIITATQIRFDNYKIDVDMDSPDFTAAENVEILNVGELKYVNDVPDSTESDSSSIASIQGDWEMTFFDKTDAGNSFKDELLNLTSEAFVTITLTDLSGNEYKFYRNIKPYGFEYDALTLETLITFRPLTGDFYNSSSTVYPSIDDIVNPLGSAGTDTDATVDGAGQTGFTLNVATSIGGNPLRMPAIGEVVYLGSPYTAKPYKVASITASSITFENEIFTAPADGQQLFTRRYQFIVDDGSVNACMGLEYLKWALEDVSLQIPNFGYEVYNQDTEIRHFRRSTSIATDLFREFDTGDTTNPDAYVIQDGTGGTAYILFARLCALCGYFWGQGFSENWLVSRLNTDSPVTITSDEVENVKQIIRRPRFTDIKSTIQDDGIGLTYVTNRTATNTEITPDGKTLEYTGIFKNLCTAVYDGTDTGTLPLQYNVDNVLTGTMEDFLTENGADAYYASNIHRGDNRQIDVTTYANGQQIEFQYIGILGLRPYDAIQFDTSVDAIFQSKTYRISQIVYDFANYICNVEAYRIA